MTLVLRKGFLGYSSGTALTDDMVHELREADCGFDPDKHVTKLRLRSELVPLVPRALRPDRLAKRRLWRFSQEQKAVDES